MNNNLASIFIDQVWHTIKKITFILNNENYRYRVDYNCVVKEGKNFCSHKILFNIRTKHFSSLLLLWLIGLYIVQANMSTINFFINNLV